MSLLVILLNLSHASAQQGELELIEAEAEEEAERRIGEPMFLLAYVLLAGLGVLTTLRTGAEE
jgi:hypothetical protein